MNQKGSLLIILLISIAIVLLIGGGGVFLYFSGSSAAPIDESPQGLQAVVQEKVTTTSLPQNNQPLPAPSQKIASASSSESGVGDWKTYSEPSLKFSIKYPGTWFTIVNPKLHPTQTSAQLFNNTPTIDDKENMIAEVSTFKMNAEDMIKVFNYDDGKNKLVSLVETVTIQGKSVYRITHQSAQLQDKAAEELIGRSDKFYIYIIQMEGYTIELDILKSQDDIARRMITTLRAG